MLGVKVLGITLFLNFGKFERTQGILISSYDKGKTTQTQSTLEKEQWSWAHTPCSLPGIHQASDSFPSKEKQ